MKAYTNASIMCPGCGQTMYFRGGSLVQAFGVLHAEVECRASNCGLYGLVFLCTPPVVNLQEKPT